MDPMNVLLICAILVLLYYIFKKMRGGYSNIHCRLNTKYKPICEGGSAEAIEILDTVNNNVIKYIDYMVHKYSNGDPNRRNIVNNLKKRYNSKNITETHPMNTDNDTSYVTHNGNVISICIRHYDEADDAFKFHDINTIMYVMAHEMVHIALNEMNHTDEFWKTFYWFAQDIAEAGLYDPVDYTKNPVKYCNRIDLI